MVLGLAAGLAACGGRSKPAPETAPVEARLPITPPPMAVTRPVDIPLPPHHSLDLDRTVMVGSDTEWLGRASMTAPIEPIGIWEYYRREMPRQGWTEISASENPNRVLFYQRGARVAVVEVWPGANGSRIDIWMNPRPVPATPAVSAAPAPEPLPETPPSAPEAVPSPATEASPQPWLENTPLPPP